jgi:hypothetical protein
LKLTKGDRTGACVAGSQADDAEEGVVVDLS